MGNFFSLFFSYFKTNYSLNILSIHEIYATTVIMRIIQLLLASQSSVKIVKKYDKHLISASAKGVPQYNGKKSIYWSV